jgi:hypothetical protein
VGTRETGSAGEIVNVKRLEVPGVGQILGA